jgi:hypothetical protein
MSVRRFRNFSGILALTALHFAATTAPAGSLHAQDVRIIPDSMLIQIPERQIWTEGPPGGSRGWRRL